MKLVLNNAEFELELYNTDFVEYWLDWAFADGDEIILKCNWHGTQEAKHLWSSYRKTLHQLLERVNTHNVGVGLTERYMYPIEEVTSEYLVAVHEQWAQLTKESGERHLDVYDETVDKQIGWTNVMLEKYNQKYDDINTGVHNVEFRYRFYHLHNIQIPRPQIARGDYVIKPEDTSFTKDSLSIPYYDIGRPQFEKWLVSGEVEHEEISNYLNIANRIEINSSRVIESGLDRYSLACQIAGVECFGPHVNIAAPKERNHWKIGEFFLINYQEGDNELKLVK